MNRFGSTAIAVLLAGLASGGLLPAAEAGDASVLQNNPFRRPVFDTNRPAPSADGLSGDWDLDLRAVLVAGTDSLVNVAGTIIRVGQEHDGYRLVSVDEHTVVFNKDGENLNVELHEEDEDDEQE